jgi:hypothetical protein
LGSVQWQLGSVQWQLGSAQWSLLADVSGQPIDPTFKGQKSRNRSAAFELRKSRKRLKQLNKYETLTLYVDITINR